MEDEATARELRQLNCDIGQRYLYGKPIPIEEFNAEVQRHAAARAPRTLSLTYG